eukprot:1435554-Prymnesium_polylepis.2
MIAGGPLSRTSFIASLQMRHREAKAREIEPHTGERVQPTCDHKPSLPLAGCARLDCAPCGVPRQ